MSPCSSRGWLCFRVHSLLGPPPTLLPQSNRSLLPRLGPRHSLFRSQFPLLDPRFLFPPDGILLRSHGARVPARPGRGGRTLSLPDGRYFVPPSLPLPGLGEPNSPVHGLGVPPPIRSPWVRRVPGIAAPCSCTSFRFG